MDKTSEGLRAIMDLTAEWRAKNKVGDVTVCILSNGLGWAYACDSTGRDIGTGRVQYLDHKNETPAAGTDGVSGN